MAVDRAQLDAFAAHVRPHYARFLEGKDDVFMTAHSHQAWPDVSREAHLEAWDDAARLVDRKWGRILGEKLEAFQTLVASRLGSSRPKDVAIASNTHELVTRLLSCFPANARVLTTDAEFHSMRRQLTRLAEEGLQLTVIEADHDDFGARLVEAARKERFDLVAFSQVTFTTARRHLEMGTITGELTKLGIPVLVDAYHAFNAVPMSVDTWPGAVFVTGGGYKYAQTGEGACWMLLPEDAAAFRPRYTGWFADFGGLEGERSRIEYGPGGDRFFGSTFDPSGIYRGVRVLEFMNAQGMSVKALRQQSVRCTELLIEQYDRMKLSEWGLTLASPRAPDRRGGFLSFARNDAAELCEALASLGVRTDARGRVLRFGTAPYTTSTEIERAMDTLAAVLRKRGQVSTT